MTSKQRVIIDCDPGQDDAVAILLAARHLDVIGITTVGGNQSLEKVTANALKVVELGGLTGIPVAAGIADPLVHRPPKRASTHGETGLDGYDFPEPSTRLHAARAVEFIIDTVMPAGEVVLAPLGPLTNIATALRLEPRLASRIPHISLMGGSADTGNITPVAEFNIWVDPEAAGIVFGSGIPITMCGLNVTHQATIGEEELNQIRAVGNTVARAVADLMSFYRSAGKRLSGHPAAFLHDPCAIAALIDPSLFTFEDMHVAVETRGTHTYGMTVCDRRFVNAPAAVREAAGAPPPNARVAMTLDHARFVKLLCDTLATY